MLLSSKGEKVYIGENASISFLQFLRRVLKKYMGPSAFTENQFKDSMLEIDVGRGEASVNLDHLDQSRADKYALVQLYREASSGILDLFTMDEIHTYLDRYNIPSPSNSIPGEDNHAKAEQASLNMMLAIGSQCRAQNPFDSFNAARSFTCAQKFAFEGFLCDPSLDMVRVFLLMAFYMLGACHRNAAFMYLGIASKAACALGLHRKGQDKGLNQTECLARWRAWKSLLILDTIVSSILGRPGGLPPMRPNEDPSCGEDEGIIKLDRPRWLASQAVFTICSRIIDLEQKIGNGTIVNSSTAEQFLKQLRQWNSTLPQELRHFAGVKEGALSPPEREMFIGATHVACTYYFTIILVTRPFLISHLVSQIRRRRRPSIERAEDTSHISDLAQACLDSAMYMSKLGFMAINSMILSNNMCLLKAWMFAAGLLLGFSMFAQSDPVPEIEEAFRNAITVLERLAKFSPQARHYFDILTSFSEAVYLRREQLGRERRKKSDRFVSQIFTADFHDACSAPPVVVLVESAASGPSQGDVGVNDPIDVDLNGAMNLEFDAASYDLSSFPQLTDEWSDVPLLSDNLYIDWESVWPVNE
ncbi:uncharacterized protein RCC_00103 [Ramularia collo-cygni]|uniref:Xylanolytic transcriptional activator regulatory domain-containing protein n=1 Tax=Ramularia collo-cygni TaxID=112498 RepID=A0A2D3UQ15_9PEZI|nr:uncharacterized protein RCC_00103 [Ramularia collo-cygni]CZT14130.1 uncharacterized protein RCC_00103 [Ramularia collo-cygni]